MKRIDLHVHSNYSDGSLSPRRLVSLAKERGIAAFALTDHDTFGGLYDCKRAAEEMEVELVFGIELSASFNDIEIHILGYFFHNDFEKLAPLQNMLDDIKVSREKRNKEMIERLKAKNIAIDYEELFSVAGGGTITRAHFAFLLVQNGFAKDFNAAFKNYLTKGCETYIPRERVAPQELFKAIKKSGGISVLAHPTLYGLSREGIENLAASLAAIGLDGIETVYSRYNKLHEQEIKRMAAKYHLRMSGGSDFHGALKPDISMGDGTDKTAIPYDILEELRKAAADIQPRNKLER